LYKFILSSILAILTLDIKAAKYMSMETVPVCNVTDLNTNLLVGLAISNLKKKDNNVLVIRL
jgi:hypothetical protein